MKTTVDFKRTQCSSSRQPETDWRCHRCEKLLGVHRDGHVHIRFSRSHEYHASLPVTATCRDCGALNRTSTPAT